MRASTDRAGEMGQANVKKLFSSYGYLIRRQPVMACPVVIRTGNKRASADVIVAPNHPHARPCTRAETVARARTHGKLRAHLGNELAWAPDISFIFIKDSKKNNRTLDNL